MSDSIIQVSPNYELHYKETNNGTKTVIKKRKSHKEYDEHDEEGEDFNDANVAVNICEDRIMGWFFEPAQILIDFDKIALNKEYDVAAVHLITPLIEVLEVYKEGQKPSNARTIPGSELPRSGDGSGQFFQKSAKKIFTRSLSQLRSNTERDFAIKILYGGCRCGFAHQGYLQLIPVPDEETKPKIVIARGKPGELSLTYKQEEYGSKEVCTLTIYAKPYIEQIKKEFKQFFKDTRSSQPKLNKFHRVWKEDWEMKRGIVPPVSRSM
ncbi:hypothetical protein NG799_21805 [Laspinema sp. D1]|uniref:Uncharacterized protein n=1 Tax=Laspinema palackyanum D2a TaxID=2953684 RepID=A0ABT2MW50_9CYAN|nr:hypothetical protein [Laspinema sp. D2a]